MSTSPIDKPLAIYHDDALTRHARTLSALGGFRCWEPTHPGRHRPGFGARSVPCLLDVRSPGIGADFGTGVIYRPPLSENIILEGGITGLVPARGLRDIYTGQTLLSAFGLIKFVF